MVVSLSGLSACVQSENPHTAEPRTYTVRFMVDGEEYAKKSADWNKAITFPEVPQKKGYTLDGWYDGDTKVSEITQGYKDFVTLVARWKTVDYVITYAEKTMRRIRLLIRWKAKAFLWHNL